MLIDRIFSILILTYLFSPINYIPIVLFILLIFSLVSLGKVPRENIDLFIPLIVLSFISFTMMISTLQMGKEIVELYKWTNIAILILLFNKNRSKAFLKVFHFFSFLSLLMIFLQQYFSENDWVIQISNIYADKELIEKNFVKGFVRSTGFNEGPGHVGVLISFNLLIIFLKFKWGIISKKNRNISLFFSIFSIVASAAKGALPLLIMLNRKLAFYVSLLLLTLLFFYFSIDDLYYLDRLTNSASGEARVEIWRTLFDKSISQPITIFFGNARVNELTKITVFDSDWIYLYFTKGILGLLIIFIVLLQLAFRLRWSKYSFIYILLIFIVIGFANPAFTDIKFGVIYFYLIISLSYLRKDTFDEMPLISK